MDGSASGDTFVFSWAFGNDTISNFATSRFSEVHDVISFEPGREASSFSEFVENATQVGQDVVYDLGGDGVNTLTIQNTHLVNLTADDFLFA